jgi:hypothetical protein
VGGTSLSPSSVSRWSEVMSSVVDIPGGDDLGSW